MLKITLTTAWLGRILSQKPLLMKFRNLESAQVRVRTAEVTQLLGQTPFQAPDIWAPSLPEERCPSMRTLIAGASE
jgi:hypothetical protein